MIEGRWKVRELAVEINERTLREKERSGCLQRKESAKLCQAQRRLPAWTHELTFSCLFLPLEPISNPRLVHRPDAE